MRNGFRRMYGAFETTNNITDFKSYEKVAIETETISRIFQNVIRSFIAFSSAACLKMLYLPDISPKLQW